MRDDDSDEAREALKKQLKAELKALLKPSRHAIGRLSARFDQIQAAADAEDRTPTEEEWADLRGLADDLDAALGEILD